MLDGYETIECYQAFRIVHHLNTHQGHVSADKLFLWIK